MAFATLAIPLAFLPAPAFADSLTQLENSVRNAQLHYESVLSEEKEIDSMIEDVKRRMAEIEDRSFPYRASADEAAVCLYKIGQDPLVLFDALLEADSLEEAVATWESYSTLLESSSAKVRRISEEAATLREELQRLNSEKGRILSEMANGEMRVHASEEALDEKHSEVEALFAAADNSRLARVSCSLAYSRKARYCDGYPATMAYEKAWASIFKGDNVPQGRSCDRGVAIPVRLAGFDDEFPRVCKTQFDYLKTSDRWMDLGVWDGTTASLQPGDILVSITGIDGASYEHSAMYVGYEIAQEAYDNILKGTDADLGRPGPYDVWASASYQWGSDRGRALCICSDGEAGSHVFRCLHPQNSKTYESLFNAIHSSQ